MIISGSLWACALLSSNAYTPPNLHRVGRNETFASISKRYSTGYERLMDANPGLVPEKLRPGSVIVIPGRIAKSETAVAKKPGTYSVQNGDTDWSIARRFDMKPSQLRSMNPGVKWTSLQPGAQLKVPVRGATPTASGSQVASAKPAKLGPTTKHTVTQGENDWIIARGFGVSPAKLRSLNPSVDWNRLRPGTKVNVPVTGNTKIARITTKRAIVAKDNVIVRAGARPDAPRLTLVEFGRFATVADRIGDYYKVRFSGGTSGWVRGDMLKPMTAAMMARAEQESGVRSIRRRVSEPETRVVRRDDRDEPRRTVRRPQTSGRRTVVASNTNRRKVAVNDYRGLVAMSDDDRSSVVGDALSRQGTRYRWGGTTPNGFDCSGLTTYVYSRAGVRLPRTAREQAKKGQQVGKDSLKKGDLVFFKTTRSDRVSHVGIYVGEGKFVHASSGGGRVRVNSLDEGYYSKRFAGARRVTNGSSKSGDTAKATSKKVEEPKETKAAEPTVAKPAEDPKPAQVKGTDAVGR